MEIDARFPAIQANQSYDTRDGEAPTPPPAGLVGSGADSKFYVSPVLRFDSRSLTVIFQVRDSRTGDVVRQFPPEAVVERYRQDPATKPFVFSSRAATEEDDGHEDVDLLAPLPTTDTEAGTTHDRSAPAVEETHTGPVDLVA